MTKKESPYKLTHEQVDERVMKALESGKGGQEAMAKLLAQKQGNTEKVG